MRARRSDLQSQYRYWYRAVLIGLVLVSVVSEKSGIGATLPFIVTTFNSLRAAGHFIGLYVMLPLRHGPLKWP